MDIFTVWLLIFVIMVVYILSITTTRLVSKTKKKLKYKKLIRDLEKKTSKKDQIQKDPLDFCKLGRAYHHGVADIYNHGKLIKGIPSDPYQAIYNYEQAILLGSYDCALDLASIYHWGITGYDLQNHEYARSIYDLIIKNGSRHDSAIARDRIARLTNDKQQQEYTPEQLQTTNSRPPQRPQIQQFQPRPPHQTTIGQQIRQTVQPYQYIGDPLPTLQFGHDFGDDGVLNDLMMFFTVDRFVDNNLAVAGHTVNDSQNVHDTGINSTISTSIKALQDNTPLRVSARASCQQIRDYLNRLPDNDKKNNALQTLSFIERNNTDVVSCNMKELEVLQLVWNRIQQSPDKDVLTENLVDQLAESVENGGVVCTTGRYTRLIDSLNYVDPLVNVRPLWAINDEIVKRSGVLFNEYINGLSEADRNIYDNDLDGVNQICSDVKKYVRDSLNTEYVEPGIIRNDLLDAELNKWLHTLC